MLVSIDIATVRPEAHTHIMLKHLLDSPIYSASYGVSHVYMTVFAYTLQNTAVLQIRLENLALPPRCISRLRAPNRNSQAPAATIQPRLYSLAASA